MRHQHQSRWWPQLLGFTALFLGLGQLPLFQMRWLVWPRLEERHRCQTVALRSEHGVSEGHVGYAGVEAPVWLYSTTLVRETVCSATTVEGAPEQTLHYRDVYLNISHQDVDQELARLRVLWPLHQAYTAWRYEPGALIFSLQHDALDRHGFALQPLVLDEAAWSHTALHWLLKLHQLLAAGALWWLARACWARWKLRGQASLSLESVDCSQWE